MHLNHDGPLQSQRLKNFALHLPVCVVIMPTSQPVASLYAAADFFLEHGEHEKGVQLLMQACQFSRALDVCSHNSITLTEVGAISAISQAGVKHPCPSCVLDNFLPNAWAARVVSQEAACQALIL